jgi:glycosyltransferase involved in cell wall biosynthesis
MNDTVLTVVLAAKDPDERQMARCLASFAALACASRLQMLLVQSGKATPPNAALASAFASFKTVDTPPRGVYAAYNIGIEHAQGRYTLFFGVDDLALPAMDAAFAALEREPFDLFAASCYMQGKGLRAPSADRRALIRANWCQQGLFYATAQLAKRRFDARYPVQADHKLNIDLVADRSTRLGIQHEPVAYFSLGGVSSQRHDLNFVRDFPAIVGAAYGRPTGLYWAWRQRLSILLYGPLEKRYANAPR